MKTKNVILALALLVGLVATGAPARAEKCVSTVQNPSGPTVDSGRMKWVRGISGYGLGADSTRISIPGAGAAVDHQDTTAWLELTGYKFDPSYTSEPIVVFQINRQSGATTDSVGYIVQTSNDSDPNTNFVNGTTTYTGTMSNTSVATTIVGVTMSSSLTVPRWVRLVVINTEVSATSGRVYFSVNPIIYGCR